MPALGRSHFPDPPTATLNRSSQPCLDTKGSRSRTFASCSVGPSTRVGLDGSVWPGSSRSAPLWLALLPLPPAPPGKPLDTPCNQEEPRHRGKHTSSQVGAC